MDRKLLDLYNRELAYLREMGAEFAREYPKIAGRLGGLDDFQGCPDPFVERLLEGFAFLAARVQLKLEAEFPRFTQSLLETVYPDYLAPTPSMCLVQFEPDWEEPALANGCIIPRDSALLSALGKTELTRCEYRTAHETILWPLRVASAGYYVQELGSLVPEDAPAAKAGLRIRIQTTGAIPLSKVSLDSLTFHLAGPGETPAQLYEQLFAGATGVLLQPAAKPVPWRHRLGSSCLRPVGFHRDQSLLPYDCRSSGGYRLLREYFALPQRFLFFEMTSLRTALQGCNEDSLDIIVLFRQANPRLENVVSAENFKLFCTPAINLFPKRPDRVAVTGQDAEFHVVADRTKPQDFEIYKVTAATGYGEDAGLSQTFLPFYAAKDPGGGQGQAYFLTHRAPRVQSQREQLRGTRSRHYLGSEVFMSLVDAEAAPYSGEIKQLGVEALCTNRDLPLHMPLGVGATDFTMEKTAPCRSIRCLGTPTSPNPSLAEGEIAWRAINHLSLNYLSLTDERDGSGASALRDMLQLYCAPGDLQGHKQIDGIRSVACRPVLRRVTIPRAASFARGIEVTVTCDEAAFAGIGVFVLGAVLAQFFANYASINSFAQTVVRSSERGEIMRWPAQLGLRPLL
ncbi:MAG: type VI secretion system baseplate subunit TssF [Sedimentisphaerales bacterium]|nr:type VI secretion system baseplate subunit TssF [Sedimentisphaerales bacterium]